MFRVLVGTEMPVRLSPVSSSMTWIRSLSFMYRTSAGLKATAVRAVVQLQSPTLLASPVARSMVTMSSSMAAAGSSDHSPHPNSLPEESKEISEICTSVLPITVPAPVTVSIEISSVTPLKNRSLTTP
jgi:hypothetical protein